MKYDVSVRKHGKHWSIEVPYLDAMTQGKSRADAWDMLKDYFKCYGISVELHPETNQVSLPLRHSFWALKRFFSFIAST